MCLQLLQLWMHHITVLAHFKHFYTVDLMKSKLLQMCQSPFVCRTHKHKFLWLLRVINIIKLYNNFKPIK